MPYSLRLAVLALFPIVAGILSVQRGQSASFDWMLYHHYNGFAYLSGREGDDILPAGLRSFWNPIVEVPFYVCTTWLPARSCGFAAGFVHGLNNALVVPIAVLALGPLVQMNRAMACLPWLLAIAGALGAGSIGMLGGANNDNIVSLFFLLSLLILMQASHQTGDMPGSAWGWILLAGINVGIGCGLKLTLASFGAAIVCGPLFFAASWHRRIGLLVACAIGAAAGLLLASGALMQRMAERYGNPMFPYFNRLFEGPYRDFVDARDLRYLPGSVVEALLYPFVFALDPLRVSEFAFRDFRLAGVAVLVVACAFAAVLRRLPVRLPGLQTKPPVLLPPAKVLLGVLAVGYGAWMGQASVYRYLYPLEILSFVVMAVLLGRILAWRGQIAALVVLAGLIVPSMSPVASRRLRWAGPDFLIVNLPPAPVPAAGAIVLMAGSGALSYVIPSFPADVRFIGVDTVDRLDMFATGENGGITIAAEERDLGPFGPSMRTVISAHGGQILGLFNANDVSRQRAASAFARYGLAYEQDRCGAIRSNVAVGNPLLLCELRAR